MAPLIVYGLIGLRGEPSPPICHVEGERREGGVEGEAVVALASETNRLAALPN